MVGGMRPGITSRAVRMKEPSGCIRPSSRVTWKKNQIPTKSLSSPVTKRSRQPPSIVSLPNDVLACILRKALKASPVSVLGKEIHEISSSATFSEVSSTFKSIVEQNSLSEIGRLEDMDLSYPFTFYEASKLSATPAIAENFNKSKHHGFIVKSLKTAILHPQMSRELQHLLICQISRSGVNVSQIAFTDGYGYETKEIPGFMPYDREMKLSQLPKLETIEVNMPSSYLLQLLRNSFCNVASISLYGILPSALMEVLPVVRSRHSRSEQVGNSGTEQRLPSCCTLDFLRLSVKLPPTNCEPKRSIAVKQVMNFLNIISRSLNCFRTLKSFSFHVDNAPEIVDELTHNMQRSNESWIVPIHSDIQFLANGYGNIMNHGRKQIPATAHVWFCEKRTQISDLCAEATQGRDVKEVERFLCRSDAIYCGTYENILLFTNMCFTARVWIKGICHRYGNSITKLEIPDLPRKTILGSQFDIISSLVKDLTFGISRIRGISISWFFFDHLTNEQGIFNELDLAHFLVISPHKLEWFEIFINDDHIQPPEWRKTFVDRFVSILPLFIHHLISYRQGMRSIIISKKVKESLPMPDRSAVQETISSVEAMEKKNPLLDLSSVRNYLVEEKNRSC